MKNYLSRLVREILKKDVKCRDDLFMTLKQVHDKELALWSYSKEQYYDAFFSEKLSNPETVGRIWRLLQEKFPELRGSEWEERQKKAGLITKEAAMDRLFQLDLFEDFDL